MCGCEVHNCSGLLASGSTEISDTEGLSNLSFLDLWISPKQSFKYAIGILQGIVST